MIVSYDCQNIFIIQATGACAIFFLAEVEQFGGTRRNGFPIKSRRQKMGLVKRAAGERMRPPLAGAINQPRVARGIEQSPVCLWRTLQDRPRRMGSGLRVNIKALAVRNKVGTIV
jgi:hypothetical protein